MLPRLLCGRLLRLPVVRLHPPGLLLPLRAPAASPRHQQEALQTTDGYSALYLGGFQRGK